MHMKEKGNKQENLYNHGIYWLTSMKKRCNICKCIHESELKMYRFISTRNRIIYVYHQQAIEMYISQNHLHFEQSNTKNNNQKSSLKLVEYYITWPHKNWFIFNEMYYKKKEYFKIISYQQRPRKSDISMKEGLWISIMTWKSNGLIFNVKKCLRRLVCDLSSCR